MNKQVWERLGYVVAGAIVGSAATYAVVRKRLALKYRDIAEDEIASVKESYDLLYKQGEYSDPKKAFEAFKGRVEELDSYEGMLDENGYFKEELLDEGEEEDVKKPDIMDDGRPDPEIIAKKEDTRERPPRVVGGADPYVITVEEFMQDNEDYSKITVTYYEYDNTLSSEDDSIIQTHEKFLGMDFMNYIGWESGSDHTVYVRNDNLSSDYEILVDPGSYEEEVLGILPDDHPKKVQIQMRNDE